MANPFGIEQVDVPGILGVYQGAQDRRVNQMLLQRKMAAEDRELAKHDTISSIWKNYQSPGQSKGGDPSSPAPAATPLPAPVAALAAGSTPSPLSGAYAAPSAPLADIPGVIAGVGKSGAPLDAAVPAAATGAAPSPMGNLPPVNPASVTPEDQSFVQANEQGIRQLMGLDPEQGMQFLKFAQGLDADKRAKIVDAQDAIHTLAAALQNVPYGERKAVLAQQASGLLAAHPGLTPQMIEGFDPTDQNIQVAIGQSIGVKGILEHAEKTATMTETARHDRAEETNSANNGMLAAGYIPPGLDAGSAGDGPAGTFAKPPATAQARVAQLSDAWAEIAPGSRVTSGIRSPQEQAALKARGVTFTTNSDHGNGNAIDVPIVKGQTPQSIEAAYAARGIPVHVIQESGVGPGQGTGPHFHIKRLAGGDSGAPSSAGGLRIIPGGKLDHSDESLGIDDATVDFYAQKVAAGGDIPMIGTGKESAAWRRAIVKRAAAIQSGQGMTGGDSNLQHADVKSAGAALTALQKTRNSLDPFIQTFDGASAQARALAPKGLAGSAPVFNRWVQAGRRSINGDPDVTKLDVAITAVVNENAKIMSGASGGAVTSDSARAEAWKLINDAQNIRQFYGALDQMHTDSHIRLKSLDDRQAALRATISGHGTAPPVATAHVANAADYAALPSGAHYIDPQGHPRVKK